MKSNNIFIKDIAEKLGKGARVVSDEIKDRIPYYVDHLKALANLGKNISLDVDAGVIKIREEYVNDYLRGVSFEDNGLQSIRISCREGKASFFIELKKFLFEGVIELPFTVKSFVFNKDKRMITFQFGDRKIDKINNYSSKILFWFSVSIISIFYRKNERIKKGVFCRDSVVNNADGTQTLDLNQIPELTELFGKDMANIRYWDLVSMDKLSFEKGLIILRLSNKLATIIRTSIGIVEVLPVGRLIRPLLNRF